MAESVAVVGGSLAGIRTVEALRRGGFTGRVSVVGAENELPYDRPPLSKQFLVDDWPDEKLALCRDGVDSLEVDWHLGVRADALDPDSGTLSLDDGSRLTADVVVLATGAIARRLPFGREMEGVLELRTLDDARKLRARLGGTRRVVVVGAGFIGMEVAASCRLKGHEVAVIESLEAPLIRGLGRVLGERVAERHREEGVSFHLGTSVTRFEGDDTVKGVVLESGEVLEADVVVVGVGAVPAIDWLEGSGLDLDNGILCDASGRTRYEGVYAVGDCARWEHALYPGRPRFEHWTSAVEQSGIVANRILTGEAPHSISVPYVWTDQFDLRIAIAGEIEPKDEMDILLGEIQEDQFLAIFGRNGRLVAAVGFKRPRQLQQSRRMIADGVAYADALATFE